MTMSNTPNVSRTSEKQESVRNLTPKGMPAAKVKKISATGRDRFKGGKRR
jgi:hypothetical protein